MPQILLNNTENISTFIVPIFEDDTFSIETVFTKVGFNQKAYLENFKANVKETIMVIGNDGQQIYFLGLGKKRSQIEVLKTFRSFFYNKKEVLKGNIAIYLDFQNLSEFAENVANGIFLAEYQIGVLKKKVEKYDWFASKSNVSFLKENNKTETLAKSLEKGKMLAETQAKMMAWVDAPANYKTPQMLASWIAEAGKTTGFTVTNYDKKACEKIGLHAFLAVGKGSLENPPVFVVMEYKHPKATQTVALIGKGVTFDTGGVSLKAGENMNYMKCDMGGAAAVVGTIEMAAKLGLAVNIIAAVPFTENCIDSLAIKPGDVIGSYSGKTIEVINTDAEGRLILADALTYIKKTFEPDIMIDLATLTGNCIAALGYAASALLSNNDKLAEQLLKAGQTVGEKTWRMPLWDDYKDMMKSDVADIKNLSSAPVAGAITAAKFLEEFIDGHTNWAHLDIAGVAFTDSEYGTMKNANAYGIRLLVEWLKMLD
jgi:leucyl aminopeptidase